VSTRFWIGKHFCCGGPNWANHIFVEWGKLLVERHSRKCGCSYCQRIKWPVALWLPEDRSWNSWRVIPIRLMRTKWYIRWTHRRPETC
jgi:hypothetical protein